MANNNPNPHSSTCLQAVLELRKAGFPISEELLKQLQGNYNLLRKADKALDAHRYPDKKVKYVQLQRTAEGALLSLSSKSQALLMLLMMHAGANGLVSISADTIKDYLGCSKSSVSVVTNELLRSGLLAVYRPGGSRHASIYCLSPSLMTIGKGNHSIWSSIEHSDAKSESDWGHQSISSKDENTYNYIIPLSAPDIKKEPLASTERPTLSKHHNNTTNRPGQIKADQDDELPF